MKYVPSLNRKPHVFLSHSSVDKEFVRKLAYDLEVCEIDVWFDEWEIEPGDSIYKLISSGISNSHYVALIISESFLKSKWVSEEVESAFARQMRQQKKVIIPILIEDVTPPPLIEDKLYISFVESYYKALAKLTGILHGITPRTISEAITNINPQSLKDVLKTLAFCGIYPFMIISKKSFDEIVKFHQNFVDVYENKIIIKELDALYREANSDNIRKLLDRLKDIKFTL